MRAQAQHSVPADIVGAARRIEAREALSMAVSLHLETGEALAATLTDLTTRGCRLTLVPSMTEAMPDAIYVTICARSTMVGGRVAWSDARTAEIEFTARLLPKTLRLLGG